MNENVKIENKIFPAEVYRIYYSTLKEIKEEHKKIAVEEKAEKRKKLI